MRYIIKKFNTSSTIDKKGWFSFGNGDGLKDMKTWIDDYINILASLRLLQ